MDETLVCAYREASLPESLRTAAAQHAAGAFRLPSKARLSCAYAELGFCSVATWARFRGRADVQPHQQRSGADCP